VTISPRVRWALAIVTVATLALAACGDSGSDNASSDTGPSSGTASTTSLAPRVGGVLTMATFSETAGLDPLVSAGGGRSGATEMAAIYDVLMRYNAEKGTYEPQMAESLTANADSTVFMLKLRPGVKFTDGTDYNADAVKYSLDRHRSGLPGAPPCADLRACPKNATQSTGLMGLVKDVQVVDPLTVQINLVDSWPGFPYALTAEPGMVPSPTALRKCDVAKTPLQCDFNLNPVGAGPFMIESFKSK